MVKKWEIYYLNLDPTKGREQRGDRPVLVISNNAVNAHLPVFTCIPFSSIKPNTKLYPTEVYISTSESGLSKDSCLMLQQIRTVSTDRIIGCNAAGVITDNKVKERINTALLEYFELD